MTLDYALKMNTQEDTHLGYSSEHLYECAAYGDKQFYENCVHWTCYRQLDTVKRAFKYQYRKKDSLLHLEDDFEKDFLNILIMSAYRPMRIVQIDLSAEGKEKCEIIEHECTGLLAVLKVDGGSGSIQSRRKRQFCPKRLIDAEVRIG